MKTKECSKCHREKLLDSFTPNANGLFGRHSICRACKRRAVEPIVDLPGEEWRDIRNYEGIYRVSNLGRVKSLDRIDLAGRKLSGRLLQGSANAAGRSKVDLYNGSGGITCPIPKLVTEAFLGKCPDGLEINHKDGKPANNQLGNLEYVTHIENMRHKQEVLGKHNRGENNGFAKLTEDDVRRIRRQYREQGYSQYRMAKEEKVSRSQIGRILSGECWGWLD